MIDFIKLNDLAIGPDIRNHLAFCLNVVEGTGEVLPRKIHAKLLNLIFTITPGPDPFVKMSGSIHGFSNQGRHNYDRFTLSRFRAIAGNLIPYIAPGDHINVIEFGVNITVPFHPREFIKSLIAHKGKRVNITDRPGELYAEIRYSQFTIKIYDKGLQEGQHNKLRLEVKCTTMESKFPDGLKWGDLGEQGTWTNFGSILLSTFEEILYYDPSIDLRAIPASKDRDILEQGNSSQFWEGLKKSKYKHTDRKRLQFQKAVRKYGSTFNQIRELIEEEITSLIDVSAPVQVVSSDHNETITDNKKVVNSDHFLHPLISYSFSNTCEKVVNSDTLLSYQYSPCALPCISITPTGPQPRAVETDRKACQVTGHDISMQKPDSKFLGSTGLQWLLKNDQESFEKLRQTRLSKRWQTERIEIQIREMAHSIRNEYHNPVNNADRDIRRITAYPTLFNQDPYILHKKKELAQKSFKNRTNTNFR